MQILQHIHIYIQHQLQKTMEYINNNIYYPQLSNHLPLPETSLPQEQGNIIPVSKIFQNTIVAPITYSNSDKKSQIKAYDSFIMIIGNQWLVQYDNMKSLRLCHISPFEKQWIYISDKLWRYIFQIEPQAVDDFNKFYIKHQKSRFYIRAKFNPQKFQYNLCMSYEKHKDCLFTTQNPPTKECFGFYFKNQKIRNIQSNKYLGVKHKSLTLIYPEENQTQNLSNIILQKFGSETDNKNNEQFIQNTELVLLQNSDKIICLGVQPQEQPYYYSSELQMQINMKYFNIQNFKLVESTVAQINESNINNFLWQVIQVRNQSSSDEPYIVYGDTIILKHCYAKIYLMESQNNTTNMGLLDNFKMVETVKLQDLRMMHKNGKIPKIFAKQVIRNRNGHIFDQNNNSRDYQNQLLLNNKFIYLKDSILLDKIQCRFAKIVDKSVNHNYFVIFNSNLLELMEIVTHQMLKKTLQNAQNHQQFTYHRLKQIVQQFTTTLKLICDSFTKKYNSNHIYYLKSCIQLIQVIIYCMKKQTDITAFHQKFRSINSLLFSNIFSLIMKLVYYASLNQNQEDDNMFLNNHIIEILALTPFFVELCLDEILILILFLASYWDTSIILDNISENLDFITGQTKAKWLSVILKIIQNNSNECINEIQRIYKHFNISLQFTNKQIKFLQNQKQTMKMISNLKSNKHYSSTEHLMFILVNYGRKEQNIGTILRSLCQALLGLKMQQGQINNDEILEESQIQQISIQPFNSNTLTLLQIFEQYLMQFCVPFNNFPQHKHYIFIDKTDQDKENLFNHNLSESELNIKINSEILSEYIDNSNSKQSLQSLTPISKIYNSKTPVKQFQQRTSHAFTSAHKNNKNNTDFNFYDILNYSTEGQPSIIALFGQFSKISLIDKLIKIAQNLDFPIKSKQEYVNSLPILQFHQDLPIFQQIAAQIDLISLPNQKRYASNSNSQQKVFDGMFLSLINKIQKKNSLHPSKFQSMSRISKNKANHKITAYLQHFYMMGTVIVNISNIFYGIVSVGCMNFSELNQIQNFAINILLIILNLPPTASNNVQLYNFRRSVTFLDRWLKNDKNIANNSNFSIIYLLQLDEIVETVNNLLLSIINTKIRLHYYPFFNHNLKKKLFLYQNFEKLYNKFLTLKPQSSFYLFSSMNKLLPLISKAINFYAYHKSQHSIILVYRGTGNWPWKNNCFISNTLKQKKKLMNRQNCEKQISKSFGQCEKIREYIEQLYRLQKHINYGQLVEKEVSMSINRAKQTISNIGNEIKTLLKTNDEYLPSKIDNWSSRIQYKNYLQAAIHSFAIPECLSQILLCMKIQYELEGPILYFLCLHPPKLQIFKTIYKSINPTKQLIKIFISSLKVFSKQKFSNDISDIVLNVIKQVRNKMNKQLFLIMLGLIIEVYPDENLCISIYEILLQLIKQSKVHTNSYVNSVLYRKTKQSLLYKNSFSASFHKTEDVSDTNKNLIYTKGFQNRQSCKFSQIPVISLAQYISSYKTVQSFCNYLCYVSSLPSNNQSSLKPQQNHSINTKKQLNYINKFITLLFRLCLVNRKVSDHFTLNIIKYDSLFQIAFFQDTSQCLEGLMTQSNQISQQQRVLTKIPYQYKLPITVFFRSDTRIPQDEIVLHDYMIWISKVLKQYKMNNKTDQINSYIYRNNKNYYDFHKNTSSQSLITINSAKEMKKNKLHKILYQEYLNTQNYEAYGKNSDTIIQKQQIYEFNGNDNNQYWDMLYQQPFHQQQEGLLVFLEDIAINIKDTQHLISFSQGSLYNKNSVHELKQKTNESIFDIYESLYQIVGEFEKKMHTMKSMQDYIEKKDNEYNSKIIENHNIGNMLIQKCRKIILILKQKFPKLKSLPKDGEMSSECIAFNIVTYLLKNKLLIKFIKIFYYNQYKSINHELKWSKQQKNRYCDQIEEDSLLDSNFDDNKQELSFKNSRSSKIQNMCSKQSIRMTQKNVSKYMYNTNKQISIKQFMNFQAVQSQQDVSHQNDCSSQGLVINNNNNMYKSVSNQNRNTIDLNLNKHYHFCQRQYMFYEVIKLLKKVCDHQISQAVYQGLQEYFIQFYENGGYISILTQQIMKILNRYRDQIIEDQVQDEIFYSVGHQRRQLQGSIAKIELQYNNIIKNEQYNNKSVTKISKQISYLIDNNELILAERGINIVLQKMDGRQSYIKQLQQILQHFLQKFGTINGSQKYLQLFYKLCKAYLPHNKQHNKQHYMKLYDVMNQYIFNVVMSLNCQIKSQQRNIQKNSFKKKDTLISIKKLIKKQQIKYQQEQNKPVYTEQLQHSIYLLVKVYCVIQKYIPIFQTVNIYKLITNSHQTGTQQSHILNNMNLLQTCSHNLQTQFIKNILSALSVKYYYQKPIPNVFNLKNIINSKNKQNQTHLLPMIKYQYAVLFNFIDPSKIMLKNTNKSVMNNLLSTNINICSSLHLIGIFYQYIHQILWNISQNTSISQINKYKQYIQTEQQNQNYGMYAGIPYMKAKKQPQNIKGYFVSKQTNSDEEYANIEHKLLINQILGFSQQEDIWQIMSIFQYYLIITILQYQQNKNKQNDRASQHIRYSDTENSNMKYSDTENSDTKQQQIIMHHRLQYLIYLVQLSMNIFKITQKIIKNRDKTNKTNIHQKQTICSCSDYRQMCHSRFYGPLLIDQQLENTYKQFYKYINIIGLNIKISKKQIPIIYMHFRNNSPNKYLQNYQQVQTTIQQYQIKNSKITSKSHILQACVSLCLQQPGIDLHKNTTNNIYTNFTQKLQQQSIKYVLVWLSFVIIIANTIIIVNQYQNGQTDTQFPYLLIINSILIILLIYNRLITYLQKTKLKNQLFGVLSESSTAHYIHNDNSLFNISYIKQMFILHYLPFLILSTLFGLSIGAIFQPVLSPLLLLIPIILTPIQQNLPRIFKQILLLILIFIILVFSLLCFIGGIAVQLGFDQNLTYLSQNIVSNSYLQFLYLVISEPTNDIIKFRASSGIVGVVVGVQIMLIIVFMSFIGYCVGKSLSNRIDNKQKRENKKVCQYRNSNMCTLCQQQMKQSTQNGKFHKEGHKISNILQFLVRLLSCKVPISIFDRILLQKIKNKNYEDIFV